MQELLGFDDGQQRKARKYLYCEIGASLLKYAVLIALAMLVISLRLSFALDNLITTYVSAETLSIALFVLIGCNLFWLVSLPFDYYKGYILERRFELSAKTSARWFRDHLKIPVISSLAFLFFESICDITGSNPQWLLVAVVISCILFIVFLSSLGVFIESHFFKCQKLENTEMLTQFTKLAGKAGLKRVRVFEMKVKDATKKSIAASSGLGATKRILLSDTLISNFSQDEIEGIVSHELGHHKHGDVWKYAVTLPFFLITSLFITYLIIQTSHNFFGSVSVFSITSFPLWALIFGSVYGSFVPLMNTLSRRAEGYSDQYELDLVENPDAYISSMVKLCDQNLRYAFPSGPVECIFYDHPSGKKRVERALSFKKSLSINHFPVRK